MTLPTSNKKKEKARTLTPTGAATASIQRPAGAGAATQKRQTAAVGGSLTPVGAQKPVTAPRVPTVPQAATPAKTAASRSGGLRSPMPDPANPLLTERGAAEKYKDAPRRTLSEIYLASRGSPLVDELVAEMEAEEEARKSPVRDPEQDAALGKAVYESLFREPDEAVEAGRRAEANAYDAARRGAGGAGTSYAAMAGARAYEAAYGETRDRIKAEEEAAAEKKKSEAEAAEAERLAAQEREAEIFGTVMDAYDGTNEDSIRQWLALQGVSSADAENMLRAVSGDWEKSNARAEAEAEEDALMKAFNELIGYYDGTNADWLRNYASQMMGLSEEDIETVMGVIEPQKASAAELGYDEDAARALLDELLRTDENGNPIYDGTTRESTKYMMTQRYGYDEATVDAALDMYDELQGHYQSDIGGEMANAVIKNDTANAYTLAGKTEAEWAEMDDEARSNALMDGMRTLIRRGEIDTTAFAEVSKTVAVENVQAAIEENDARSPIGSIWDTVKGKVGEEILLSAADAVLGLKEDLKEGYLTEEQYRECLMAVGEAAEITEVYEKYQEKTFASVANNVIGAISGGWLADVIVDGVNWSTKKKHALEELLNVMETGNG